MLDASHADRAYAGALEGLERALAFGIHPSLDGIRALTEALGRPQDSFRSVQVTGTNGKTSTARLTAALLRAEGIATGLYTSPHLERYPERIEVDGTVATDEEFGSAVLAALDAADSLRPGAQGTPEGFTEFELLTAAALWHFRERGVRIAVLEVGLGGTWDATSVVDPVVAVITGVGLDHASILGDTLEEIAEEKAGIIKPGALVVLGPGTTEVDGVFERRALAAGAKVRRVRSEHSAASEDTGAGALLFDVVSVPTSPGGLTRVNISSEYGAYHGLDIAAPSYQAANLATALAAAESGLGRVLGEERVRESLRAVALPGRFEIVSREPLVVVDGSHNPQAAATLSGAVAEAWPRPGQRPDMLLGVLGDKDVEGIVSALQRSGARLAAVCTPDSERALPAEALAEAVERLSGVRPRVFSSVASALQTLVPTTTSGLIVTGSLTTAGEARAWLRRHA